VCAEAQPEPSGGRRQEPRSYGGVAWCYDELATVYSLGQIDRAKESQAREFQAGDRVLFAGVGRGRDAIAAARRGARVTCLDVAPAMLRRLEDGLRAAGLEARVIEQDVFVHASDSGYDVVTANFFLNLFSALRLASAVRALGSLVRPGGRLLVADFAAPSGGPLRRMAARAYFQPLNWIAALFGLCDRHPGYDYGPALEDAGFAIERRELFPLWRGGAIGFEAIVARKAGVRESGMASGRGQDASGPRSSPSSFSSWGPRARPAGPPRREALSASS